MERKKSVRSWKDGRKNSLFLRRKREERIEKEIESSTVSERVRNWSPILTHCISRRIECYIRQKSG